MHDNPSTELARNSNSFLPVNLFDFPSFGFLEAAQRFLDTPVRASMKCEEFVDSDQLVVRAELPGVDPENGIKDSVSDGNLTIQATREESKEERTRTASAQSSAMENCAGPWPCHKTPGRTALRPVTRTGYWKSVSPHRKGRRYPRPLSP